MKTVFTGFGVILAISASKSFAPASVCLASTTITLVLPMMIVLLPPAPPRPAHTSGFNILMVSGGGGCCAMVEMERALHNSTATPRQRIFEFDIVVVLSWKGLYYRAGNLRKLSHQKIICSTCTCICTWPDC